MQTLKATWKAVVALLIPIAFGAASEAVEAIGEWATTSNQVWTGVVVGAVTSIGVWLKANRPRV